MNWILILVIKLYNCNRHFVLIKSKDLFLALLKNTSKIIFGLSKMEEKFIWLRNKQWNAFQRTKELNWELEVLLSIENPTNSMKSDIESIRRLLATNQLMMEAYRDTIYKSLRGDNSIVRI